MDMLIALIMDFVLGIVLYGPIILIVLMFAIPKKNGYEYNILDKKGIISNVVLSCVYVLLSVITISLIFLPDGAYSKYSSLKQLLFNVVINIAVVCPFISLASITTSVISRKRGKSKFSFAVQFVPLFAFAIFLVVFCFFARA